MDEAGNIETIKPVPLPKGWFYDKTTKTKVTAVKSAEDIDLTYAYGEGIVSVDGSKIANGIEIIGNDLDNYIKKCNRIDYIANKISKLIGRKTTEYEKYVIEEWYDNVIKEQ